MNKKSASTPVFLYLLILFEHSVTSQYCYLLLLSMTGLYLNAKTTTQATKMSGKCQEEWGLQRQMFPTHLSCWLLSCYLPLLFPLHYYSVSVNSIQFHHLFFLSTPLHYRLLSKITLDPLPSGSLHSHFLSDGQAVLCVFKCDKSWKTPCTRFSPNNCDCCQRQTW